MSRQLDVDEEVFKRLQMLAEPFVDTPNTVLRRTLGLDGNREAPAQKDLPKTAPLRADKPVARQKRRPTTPPRTKNRKRAAKGTVLREEAYQQPLLQALADLGGEARSGAVIERVGELLDDQITSVDREMLSSGSIRWENRVQFVRLKLIDRGLMERNSPRGVWAISEKGRARLLAGDSQ